MNAYQVTVTKKGEYTEAGTAIIPAESIIDAHDKALIAFKAKEDLRGYEFEITSIERTFEVL